MGYGRFNKEFDISPRYPNMVADVPVLLPEETVESSYIERSELPEAPGVSDVWAKAVESSRQKYPESESSYHETVVAAARQKNLKIPYVLLRANIGEPDKSGYNDKGYKEAVSLVEGTNANNHVRSMIAFLGQGAVPMSVKPSSVETAVSAVRTQCEAEVVHELNDAYTFWQQVTGHISLANLVETE